MPKIFSEHERAIIQESMLDVGAALLRKKGLRRVSVEDVTKGVKIAAGSFYSFYSSKEELLWDIVKREERLVTDRCMSIAAQDIDKKTKLRKIFYELYWQGDSVIYCCPKDDMDYILRKLPPEKFKDNVDNAFSLNRSILTACKLEANEETVEILVMMEQMLQLAVGSDIPQHETTRKKVFDALIETLIQLLTAENSNKNNRG